jgi:hypothetical protein
MTMNYTDTQLIERVATTAKGFTCWTDGMYAIAVRSKADVSDTFDDKLYLFEVKGGKPAFIMSATCTTHPGADVLRNFARKYNPAGAPVMLADQIVYGSHTYGLHQGRYAAYRQAKPVPYVRDKDGDGKAETEGMVHTSDMPMMNIHRANPSRISTQIVNWSAGCIVMNDPAKFNQFMGAMNKRPLNLAMLREF